jgi:hypothetical protein
MATDWKDASRELGSKAAIGDQGRALLGEALNRLHSDGYDRLELVTTLAGQRDEAQSGLDNARTYAENVYNDLPLGDGELDGHTQQRVGVALWSIAGALERQQSFINDDISYTAGFYEGLRKIAEGAGAIVPKIADAVPWWLWVLVAAAAFFYVRRLLP